MWRNFLKGISNIAGTIFIATTAIVIVSFAPMVTIPAEILNIFGWTSIVSGGVWASSLFFESYQMDSVTRSDSKAEKKSVHEDVEDLEELKIKHQKKISNHEIMTVLNEMKVYIQNLEARVKKHEDQIYALHTNGAARQIHQNRPGQRQAELATVVEQQPPPEGINIYPRLAGR